MTESPLRAISAWAYMGVLLVLLLLTALTVGISFIELPGRWHLALGLIIAVCKASLVVLIFMHVLHSQAATRAVIVVTVFWLVGVLLALTLSDYATRGSVSVIPGP
jgi:cytochrome c oxidase subunit 4